MKSKLIILRGNSGSGKSTVAQQLRERMGYGTAVVEQDYIRRKLLREKDEPDQPNIELIRLNVQFALDRGYNVIVEGILDEGRYGGMLRRLIADCPGGVHVYYFDISIEETLRRHTIKPNSHEFGEELIRELYVPHDVLGSENERIISENSSLNQTLKRILADISL